MNESLIEAYVLFSEKVMVPSIFPFNILILCIGLFFGMDPLITWLKVVWRWTSNKLVGFFRVVKQTKEPIGLYGAVLSTSVAVLGFISFVRDGDELELLLRCDRTDQFTSDERYVYVSVECAVKNSGNVTATIDAIEPTFYYSENVDLNRGFEDRSLHSFHGNPRELVSDEFTLPQTLLPGVTKIFDAKVAIPIVGQEEKLDATLSPWPLVDAAPLLSRFRECLKTDRPENCFHTVTGKFIPNYLYETIRYPAGPGVQSINGVGISVSDFFYTSEAEVDLFSGLLPYQPNDSIELLAVLTGVDHINNLQRPWWQKEYTFWHLESDTSSTGVRSNFLMSTIQYFLLIVSIYGWLVILQGTWRKVRNAFVRS